MNQYNFGSAQYAADHHQQFAHGTAPYHQAPDGTTATYTQSRTYELETGISQHAFDQNQRLIPGLGLAPGQKNEGPMNWSASGQNTGSNQTHTSLVHESANTKQLDKVTTDSSLSDGELEDIYEPTAGESAAPIAVQPPDLADDRLGSYSPQLTPFNVGQHQEILGAEDMVTSALQEQSGSVNGVQATETLEKPSSTSGQLQKARADARDAIARLWPLNIRYQDYLGDGVDKPLLRNLFEELGLDLEPPAVGQLPKAGVVDESPGVREAPNANLRTLDSGDDNTESRKDRIARLLAAKRSAQQNIPANSRTSAIPEKKLPQPPSKSIDKSKLLYEKMEALRKAREAKARSASQSQQPDSMTVLASTAAGQPVHTGNAQAEEQVNQLLYSAASEIDRQFPVASQTSSPQSAHRTVIQKRPVASDFLGQRPEPASKRPFNQTDRSRRFLIDVSEDDGSDDDTAMDLDSPELRPLTLRRNATEDPTLRSHHILLEAPSNGRTTPINGLTRSNTSHGKEDLDKMQQDIEQMKRRIAEAEARKKVKQSRPGTPQQSPLHSRSEADIASPAIAAVTRNTTNPANITAMALGSPDASDSPIGSPNLKAKSDHGTPNLRRSLSRATLERLAAIEADRKRQTLKMKILRAQLTQMEREMAAGLEEEKVLREEVSQSPIPDEEISAPVLDADGLSANSQLSQSPGLARHSLGEAEPSTSASEDYSTSQPATELHPSQPSPSISSKDRAMSTSQERNSLDQDQVPMTDVATTKVSSANPSVDESPAPYMSDDEVRVDAQRGEDLDHQPDATDDGTEESSSSQSVDMADTDSESDDVSAEYVDASREDSPISTKLPSPTTQPLEDGLKGHEHSQSAGEVPVSHQPTSSGMESREDVRHDSRTEQRHIGETLAEDSQSPKESAQSNNNGHKNSFQPYESPLQYFHAYRFHPEFSKVVKGGLRSLTYSNKLDVRQQLCPDELLGQECPRGDGCDFQHIAKVAAPDDQILMQLGSYGAHEGDQQEEFNKGLRKLLTEFRDQKVKDFETISRAIIDYRAQFHHDRSKILPLGNVSL